MNRKNHRLWTAVIAPALLALSLLTSSCVEPLDPSLRGSTDPNAVSLPIRLYIPGAMPATKAGSGDVSGVSPESQIYSIQVWMYDHATGTEATDNEQKPVSYAQAYLGWNQQNNLGKWDKSGYYASGQWTSDQIYELLFKIPNSVIESTRPMKFDFYVLANGTSIGSSGSPATPTMTRGELKALKFGNDGTDDFFGSTNPVTGATAPVALGQDGLPISGFFNKGKDDSGTAATGVDLSFLRDKTKPASGDDPARPYTNDEIKAMSPVIQLERAVSKIRFAFVRPKGMAGVQITKIVIDEKLIPDNTFVFPREDGTDGTSDYSYNTAATTIQGSLNGNTRLPLLADTDIKEMTDAVPDPKSLESTSGTAIPGYSVNVAPKNMSAQQYSDLLNAFATSQLVYLRESGKKIKGKIYYKLSADGDEKSAVFEMDADDDDTNFHRNHSWIVYAYFNGGVMLEIRPYAMPWKYHENTTSFSSQVQCDGISVSGAIENTAAYMESHGGSENNYLSNLATGEVASAEDANYYANYYQVRRLLYGEGAQGYFEFKFTPSAPYGGYWMLEPFFYGSGSEDPQDMFRFEVLLADGGTSSNLMGQIIDRDVTIRIYPSSHYDYANDYNSYSVIFKSYFSPTIGFEPAYSADSELQDVHRDGRYSYWRFTLTHGDY